jgi:hypothetical protein
VIGRQSALGDCGVNRRAPSHAASSGGDLA